MEFQSKLLMSRYWIVNIINDLKHLLNSQPQAFLTFDLRDV